MKKILCFLISLLLCLLTVGLGEPLFEPKAETGFYNYCPSAFSEDGIIHIYYCTNTRSRDITDSIGYRFSTDGGMTFSDEKIVLEHTKGWRGGWDSVHTCDPDVVKGLFHWKGEEYYYLMAYLGCDTGNNQENEVGLAVAQSPAGPFEKIIPLNPFVSFQRNTLSQYKDRFQWGVGQPALVSMDKKGVIMLIYTHGGVDGTYLICEKWNLDNLETPVQIGKTKRITNAGVIGRDGKQATLNNADFAYDPQKGILYAVAEGAPCYMEGIDQPGEPTFISAVVRVLRFSQVCFENEMESFFSYGKGKWEQIASFGLAETGYPRNHNAGFITDPYGWLEDNVQLDVLYSVSQVARVANSLWTYRILRYKVQRD